MIRKSILAFVSIVIAASIFPGSLSAQGTNRNFNGRFPGGREMAMPFFSREEAPHLENVLPNPPELDDSRFADDWNKYLWGKSIRETERGQQAIADASINADYFMKRFSPAMECELTKEAYPVLYKLIERAHRTEGLSGASAKAYFKRVRPYQQFKEPTAVPNQENPNDFTSYPSGHTHASWLVGMILTAIDPAHTEPIMKVAYELGQSRVIVGFHYQSDVDAGRVAASITFARICAEPEFLDLLQQAKDEFKKNSK